MKKYKFIQLCIETTRKCNLKCEHCMRGKAQDITLTPEIIDKLLSQVTEIEDISLMGGEPLLALDALEYLIYAIERHKTKVLYIDFVTNGTIMDEHVIQLLSRFTEKNTERKARISISNDDFHYAKNSHECYEFYKPMSNDRIEVKYNGETAREAYKNKSRHLLYFSGKATSLVMKGLDFNGLPIIAGVPENKFRSHQIKIVDNTIYCGLYLAANGNLGLRSQISYADFDNLAFGNMQSHL